MIVERVIERTCRALGGAERNQRREEEIRQKAHSLLGEIFREISSASGSDPDLKELAELLEFFLARWSSPLLEKGEYDGGKLWYGRMCTLYDSKGEKWKVSSSVFWPGERGDVVWIGKVGQVEQAEQVEQVEHPPSVTRPWFLEKLRGLGEECIEMAKKLWGGVGKNCVEIAILFPPEPQEDIEVGVDGVLGEEGREFDLTLCLGDPPFGEERVIGKVKFEEREYVVCLKGD